MASTPRSKVNPPKIQQGWAHPKFEMKRSMRMWESLAVEKTCEDSIHACEKTLHESEMSRFLLLPIDVTTQEGLY